MIFSKIRDGGVIVRNILFCYGIVFKFVVVSFNGVENFWGVFVLYVIIYFYGFDVFCVEVNVGFFVFMFDYYWFWIVLVSLDILK